MRRGKSMRRIWGYA